MKNQDYLAYQGEQYRDPDKTGVRRISVIHA